MWTNQRARVRLRHQFTTYLLISCDYLWRVICLNIEIRVICGCDFVGIIPYLLRNSMLLSIMLCCSCILFSTLQRYSLTAESTGIEEYLSHLLCSAFPPLTIHPSADCCSSRCPSQRGCESLDQVKTTTPSYNIRLIVVVRVFSDVSEAEYTRIVSVLRCHRSYTIGKKAFEQRAVYSIPFEVHCIAVIETLSERRKRTRTTSTYKNSSRANSL